MKERSNKYNIIFHIIGWSIYFLFNFLFLKNARNEFVIARQVVLLSLTPLVFYLFYLGVAPLFFKKKYTKFILFSTLIILGATSVNLVIQRKYHNDKKELLQSRGLYGNGHHLQETDDEFVQHMNRRKLNKNNFNMMINLLQAFFVILVAFTLRLVQKWQYNEKIRYVLEKEKSEAELQFLKQQINPHFLFNSLNSIYSLANKKSNHTTEAILKLSGMLRYVLYHSEKERVPLSDEISTIENYIDLQRLRITDKVKLKYEISGKPISYFIEPLLLLPILENAFKYGLDSTSESTISINIEIDDKQFRLTVSNTIVPQTDNSKEESGIGLQNIKRRLELLYADHYTLELQERDTTFTVDLALTLKQ